MNFCSTRSPCSSLVAVVAAGLLISMPAPAQAPEPTGPSSAADEPLTEIVVYAQKRTQALQEVPLAVSAFSADDIERHNLTSLDDVARRVPNLSFFGGSDNANGGQVVLRGISSSDSSSGQQQSVGIYVDGVFQNGLAFSDIDLFDLARVEVLRGPQGTLFGRNTATGAINFISAVPENDFSGKANFEYGRYDLVRAGVAISGALVDSRLLGRLALSHSERDGDIRNTFDGTDFRARDATSARGSLTLLGRENSKAVLTGFFTRNRDTPTIADQTPFNYSVTADLVPREARDIAGGNLQAEFRFGSTTLTSITAFSDLDSEGRTDIDGAAIPTVFFHNFTESGARQVSQELRLANFDGEKFEWMIGAYYSDDDTRNLFQRPSLNVVFQPSGLPPPAPPVVPTRALLVTDSNVEQRSTAVFGQGTFHWGERVDLSYGFRWFEDRSGLDQLANDTYSNAVTNAPLPPFVQATRLQRTDDDLLSRFMLRYELSEDVSTYLSFSEGYKSSGFNVGSVSSVPESFGPEESKNYELGLKSLLAGRRARANVAIFYNDYGNKQELFYDLAFAGAGQTLVYVDNVGDTRVYGAELELTAWPTTWLRGDLSFGWTSAEYRNFRNCGTRLAPGVPPTVTTVDCSGNRLARSPTSTGSLDLDFGPFAIGSSVQLSIATGVEHRGSTYFDVLNSSELRQKSYELVNLDVRLAFGNGWMLTAYGRNLADEEFFTQGRQGIGASANQFLYVPGEKSSWGLRAAFEF
jgi:iron complex outermembrane recepter protein